LEAGGVFGVEGGLDQFLVGEGFERAFEGRSGDVGSFTEVVVADTAGALPAGELPEAKVDGLFGRAKVGQDGAQQFGEVHECGYSIGMVNRGNEQGALTPREPSEAGELTIKT
jgi:hypothetical protein